VAKAVVEPVVGDTGRRHLAPIKLCSRLDGIVTTARRRDVPFVPAHAEYFCVHCGFPFRNGPPQQYCREFDLKDNHGRCETRRLDAQDQAGGLLTRLRKTQEADPYAWATGRDAIAHAWVRQRYPDVSLAEWQPYRES
jgi:hypothetical protein